MPVVKKRKSRTNLPHISISEPSKGLNLLSTDTLVDDKESSGLNNIAYVDTGGVSKRTGYTQVGSALSSTPKGLANYYNQTSSIRQVVTIDGVNLKYLSGITWTTATGATFTSGADVTFTMAQDKLFVWNGIDGGAYYDGATVTRPGTIPKAKFAIYFNGYHICSGVDGQPNRVYIANTTDPTDFTDATDTTTTHPGATVFSGTEAAKYVDVSPGDGDKITALSRFQGNVIIFKQNSIHQMSFGADGVPTITPINNSIGCVSHKSVDNVENDVFFLSRNGYYVLGNEPNYFNVLRTNELSQRINPFIQTITPQNLARVCGLYSPTDFKYYISVPSGGTLTNNRLITYDRRFLAWSLGDNINASAFCEFVDANNQRHLYFASDNTPAVYEIGLNYSDNGTAINAYWDSKNFDMGSDNLKFIVDVDLIFKQLSGSVTVSIILDGTELATTQNLSSTSGTSGIGFDEFGTSEFGQSSGQAGTSTVQSSNVPYRIPVNTYARTVKLRVANANNNETFTLLSFGITYRDGGHYNFPSSQVLNGTQVVTSTPDGALVTEDGAVIVVE